LAEEETMDITSIIKSKFGFVDQFVKDKVYQKLDRLLESEYLSELLKPKLDDVINKLVDEVDVDSEVESMFEHAISSFEIKQTFEEVVNDKVELAIEDNIVNSLESYFKHDFEVSEYVDDHVVNEHIQELTEKFIKSCDFKDDLKDMIKEASLNEVLLGMIREQNKRIEVLEKRLESLANCLYL
jgi:hypothetical protein